MSERSPEAKAETRVRRDGSIKPLVDGKKYKIRIYLGCNQAGKRLYFSQVFRGTSGKASKRLNDIITDIDRGIMPTRVVAEAETPAAPLLLSEVLEKWLKHKAKTRKARPRTIGNYEWLLNSYVKPELGTRPITEITESDIQDLYNRLLERGIGAKTIRNLHKVLEPCLTRAVGWGSLTKNPAEHVELPVWEREEAKYLTEEQTLSFLAAAKLDKWYVAFLIAIETGARPNEYLALRWSDVSFDDCSVSIRRSLYWPDGGGFEFTKPKTQRSNRTITVSARAIEVLRQHKREQLEGRLRQGSDYQDHGLIFATKDGTPLLWRNLARRHLKPLLTAAEIPLEGISLYTLRHTAASLLVASGENFRVIAERLGTSTTMIDITYSHVPQKLQQTATDRLAQVLHGT